MFTRLSSVDQTQLIIYTLCRKNVTNPLINAQHLKNATEARLLIAISFHFVKDRLVYLEKELQFLAAFPVARRDIVLFTNTTNPAEQDSVRQVFRRTGLVDAGEPQLVVESHLAHPYELTWAHKRLIPSTFLASDSPYSHFIYLEDDLGMTFESFAYFLAAREFLRPFENLAPGFLRTEWSAKRECFVNADLLAPIRLAKHPFIASGDYAFIAADNPYCAGFILDQELAREYVNSRSFHLKRSRAVSPEMSFYGVRERSAMGLTYENPPAPFAYRVVVPICTASRTVPPCALLAHLPNNYADTPHYPQGKINMADLIVGPFDPKKEVVLSSFQSPKQKRLRLGHRACLRVRAMGRNFWLNILDGLRGVKRFIFGQGAPKRP